MEERILAAAERYAYHTGRHGNVLYVGIDEWLELHQHSLLMWVQKYQHWYYKNLCVVQVNRPAWLQVGEVLK